MRKGLMVALLLLFLAGCAVRAAQPEITGVSIPNVPMIVGDSVTATITVSEDPATFTLGTSSIAGCDLSDLTKVSDTTYTAEFFVGEYGWGTDYAAADDLPTDVTLADGGLTDTWTTPISQDNDPIDANRPWIWDVTIPNEPMKVGDVVTATIRIEDHGDATGTTLVSGRIGGFALGNLTVVNNWTLTAQFTITEGGTDVAAGDDIPIGDSIFTAITVRDAAGNESHYYDDPIIQDNDSIDANSPNITNVTIPNEPMKIGDIVTATITIDDNGDATGSSLIQGTIGGYTLENLSVVSDTTLTAQFTIVSPGAFYYASDPIDVGDGFGWGNPPVQLQDGHENPSNLYSGVISQDSDPIDSNRPSVVDLSFIDAMITDVDANATWTVTVEFWESMDPGTDPTIDFSLNCDATLTTNMGSWFDDKTFKSTYHVVDADVSIANISVNVTGAKDVAGNVQDDYDSLQEFSIDTENPSVSAVFDRAQITDAVPDSLVTITFSEPVIGFTVHDVTPTNGSLSSFTKVNSATWTVVFTGTDGFRGAGFVDVGAGYTDANGNPGTAGSDNIFIDRQSPTVAVEFADASLNDADDSSTVTFQFSEDVTGFAIDDLTPIHGALSSFTPVDANTYTVVFTASDGIDATGSVAVAGAGYADIVGNPGTDGSGTVAIDTLNPTVTGITADDTWITDADTEGGGEFTLRITFSEPMNQSVRPTLVFDRNLDSTLTLEEPPGTWTSANVYEADYASADANVYAEDVYVDVEDAIDANGNPMQDYTPDRKTFDVDTENPTVTIVFEDSLLSDADNQSLVTITFSEIVDQFSIDDLTPTNGTVATLTPVNPATYTVVFTAFDGVDGTGTVTVEATYADQRENFGTTGSGDVDIDTENPMVLSVGVDTDPVHEGDLTQGVTVTFSEAMDTNAPPFITFGAGTFASQADGAWSDGDTVWMETFDLTDNDETVAGVTVDVAGAKDAAGNGQQDYLPEAEFDIDTDNPAVVSVTASPTLVNDAAVGTDAFTVRVLFDETLDTGTVPTLVFSPDVAGGGTPTLVNGTGAWSATSHADDTLTVTYDVLDRGLTLGPVEIDVSGAIDLAGNEQADCTPESEFVIDTRNPAVTSLDASPSMVAEDEIGDRTFVITIDFDEPMNTGIAPTISFPTAEEDPTGMIVLDTDPGGSEWLDGDTYVARYDVVDANEEIDDIDVRVDGAQNANGNLMEPFDRADVFSYDTVRPWIDMSAVSASPTQITDDTVGTGTFTVTVEFEMAMNPAAEPIIRFSPDVFLGGTPTLANGVGAWSTAVHANDRYTMTYDVVDQNVEIDSVTIDVTDSQDAAGNDQIDYNPLHEFAIDTRRPQVSPGVFVNRPTVIDDRGGTEDEQRVTVVFDEPMTADGTADPTIVFGDGTWTSNADGAWSTGDTTWAETFTLADNDEEIADVTVDVTGARDAAGNDQEDYAAQPEFAIDTVKPRIVDITASPDDGCHIVGSVIEVSISFSEDVVVSGPIQATLDAGGVPQAHVNLGLTDSRTAMGLYVVAPGENSCDLDVIEVSVLGGILFDIAGNYEGNPLTLPPGSFMRNGVTVPVGQNLAENAEIVVDTTLPVAVDDPDGDEGRGGANDSPFIQLREDPYGRYRLTTREDTPAYIHVTFNDSDQPCASQLTVIDIPMEPEHGVAWIEPGTGRIRYSPEHSFVGPDRFTYRVADACGNVSLEATVYVEVLRQLVLEDLYVTVCAGAPTPVDVTMFDPWVDPDDPDGMPFEFAVVDPPAYGVVSGELTAPAFTAQGRSTVEVGSATFALTYVPALGFTGDDRMVVQVTDPFGASTTAVVSIAVVTCEGRPFAVSLASGELMPMIVPPSFAEVRESAWETVTLASAVDGTSYASALSASWAEGVERFILTVDGGLLPLGTYELTVPLGNGETVELTIEVQ